MKSNANIDDLKVELDDINISSALIGKPREGLAYLFDYLVGGSTSTSTFGEFKERLEDVLESWPYTFVVERISERSKSWSNRIKFIVYNDATEDEPLGEAIYLIQLPDATKELEDIIKQHY